MKTKVILITHENLGRALLEAASKTYANVFDFISVVPVYNYDDPEHIYQDVSLLLEKCQAGSTATQYLILTDLFGATPCNIATRLLQKYNQDTIAIIAGLNLPMLLKVINYRELPLSELAEKTLAGGRAGITLCQNCKE